MKISRTLLILLLLIFSYTSSHSQNKKLDSLRKIDKYTLQDSTHCNIYIKIGDIYKLKNPDSALFYYNKCYQLAEIKKLKPQEATALRLIGVIYKNQGNYEKAMDNYQRSLKIFEELNDKKGTSSCFMNMGNIYNEKGDYIKAIDYLLKSLKISEESGDKQGMSNCYTNLGNVYKNQGSYDLAMEYYFKSLKIAEELGNKKGIALCDINIGLVYKNQNSYDKANEYYFKSLKIFEELNDKQGMAQCYNNIGSIHSAKNNLDEAIKYYLMSLKINEELSNKLLVSNNYTNLGNIYDKKGNYEMSLDYYLKSLKIKEEVGDKNGIALVYGNIAQLHLKNANLSKNNNAGPHLNEALQFGLKAMTLADEIKALPIENQASEVLMKTYHKLGNYKKALEYALIFIQFSDSLNNIEKTKVLANAEAKFKAEKKQLEIDKLNKENELQQSELLRQHETGRRQKLIIGFVIAGIFVIAAFAFFVVQRLRITRRQNEEIRTQHILVTQQKDRIEKQNLLITTSINYAKRIQQAVLPTGEYAGKILGDHFIFYKPKDIVSGDFYWTTQVDDLRIIAVADCTGHGVPGAFMSMLGLSFLNEIVRKKEVKSAGDVIDHLRESIIEALQQKGIISDQKDGMDIIVCVLNSQTNSLQYAGANCPLYVVSPDKTMKVILPNKQPVAIYENMKAFTNNDIQLQSGDCIYLMSDGYEDQFGGPDDKKFMIKKLKELLINISDKPMNSQLAILEQTLDDWKGNKDQTDDITILGLKI